MSHSEDDMICIEKYSMESLADECDSALESDAESSVSDDFCVFKPSKGPPSIATACEAARVNTGSVYEQRVDIQQTKGISNRLMEELTFSDESALAEAIERVGAREHLDRDIDNEITNISKISRNEQLVDVNLQKAAQIAHEHTLTAQKTAREGQTTVKRAMEVIEHALPVFIEACNKSYEDNSLNVEVMREVNSYQQCQQMDRNDAFDINARELKETEGFQHLEKCIELAETDAKKISEKHKNELEQERLESFIETKKEVEGIVSDEKSEIDEYLKNCEKDLKKIGDIQAEQKTRFQQAKISFEMKDNMLETQITKNQQRQEDLRNQLQILVDKEDSFRKERNFQKQVQVRSEEIHNEVIQQLTHLEGAISDINARVCTAKKVIEAMEVCGLQLLDTSINAEKKYIEKLQQLVVEAKTRHRFAMATDAVEKKIIIDNTFHNIQDYKEKMTSIKQDLKKAVQKKQQLVAKKEQENLKEFHDEKKKEEERKEEAEKALIDIMEKLTVCDEGLKAFGIEVMSVDELYDVRQEELHNALVPTGDGYSSLEFSDGD